MFHHNDAKSYFGGVQFGCRRNGPATIAVQFTAMHFCLYEIAARILAVYLLVDSVQTLRRAVAEGKIRYHSSNWFDLFFGWSNRIIDRNTSPFWYWLQFCAQVATVGACLFVLIFGWHSSAGT